ncbi:hypothetical protein MHYP_G00201240 [Metynnis hypsauchen]
MNAVNAERSRMRQHTHRPSQRPSALLLVKEKRSSPSSLSLLQVILRQQAPLCFAGVARLCLPAADWLAARLQDANAVPRLAEGASVVLRLVETAVNHTRRGGGNRRLTDENLRLACCLNVQAAAASSSVRLRLPDQPAVARSSGCSFPSSAPPFSFGGFMLMLLGTTSR